MELERTCEACGKPFTVAKEKSRKRYCSGNCRVMAWAQLETLTGCKTLSLEHIRALKELGFEFKAISEVI